MNFQDKYGYTALHHVAKSRSTSNVNALSCLINHGADINAFTEFQRTALMLACACNAPINVKPQGGGGGGGRATHGKLTERAFPRVGNVTWPPSWKTERNWK